MSLSLCLCLCLSHTFFKWISDNGMLPYWAVLRLCLNTGKLKTTKLSNPPLRCHQVAWKQLTWGTPTLQALIRRFSWTNQVGGQLTATISIIWQPCNKESQEYERLLGMFLQSKGSSPWEVACSWLKSDQVENIVALVWKLRKQQHSLHLPDMASILREAKAASSHRRTLSNQRIQESRARTCCW